MGDWQQRPGTAKLGAGGAEEDAWLPRGLGKGDWGLGGTVSVGRGGAPGPRGGGSPGNRAAAEGAGFGLAGRLAGRLGGCAAAEGKRRGCRQPGQRRAGRGWSFGGAEGSQQARPEGWDSPTRVPPSPGLGARRSLAHRQAAVPSGVAPFSRDRSGRAGLGIPGGGAHRRAGPRPAAAASPGVGGGLTCRRPELPRESPWDRDLH